jgi:hypothetical protein
MTPDQHILNGIVKRAKELGYSDEQMSSILKEAARGDYLFKSVFPRLKDTVPKPTFPKNRGAQAYFADMLRQTRMAQNKFKQPQAL